MSKKTSVDITPDKSLIQKLGLTGYRTEQAIAELVDNSIDARILGKIEHVDVRLDFERKTITIVDDGIGMDLKELQDALTIAKDTNVNHKKLGQFGLGLKSSCSTLGKSFTINTSKPGSTIEYLASYDEDKWLSDKSLKWSNFEIEEQNKETKWYGTIIIISKLKVPLYPNQASNFKKRYGIRYGPYLKNNQIRLRINSLECKPVEPSIQRGTKRKINIKLPSGYYLKGWMGLLEKRSIKGDYGIHLYKNGRLIKSYDKFGITQHPEHAKIIGGLDLDHIPVNFHKTGFIDDSLEYKEAVNHFKNDPTVKEIIRTLTLQKAPSSSIQNVLDYFSGKSKSGTVDTKISKANAGIMLKEASAFKTIDQGKNIELEFRDKDEAKTELYSLEQVDSGIKLVINRQSDVFKAVRNPLFLIGLIEAEAKIIAENPSKYSRFIQDRNRLWSKFIVDWSAKEKKKKRKIASKIGPLPHYNLSSDLVDLHDFLKEKFEHNFQFTGLSTLFSFLQNAYSKIIYTICTINGAGQQLHDLILDYNDSEFIVLLNPKSFEIKTALEVSDKQKFLVIREYAEKPTSDWAIPEKAWLDLYIEIIKHKVPISTDELFVILDGLMEAELIDKTKLKSIARHKNILAEIYPYLEEEM